MIGRDIVKISSDDLLRSPATLQVDVIADFICPWCYLGKKRLDTALESVHGPSVVTWYPFQLNPEMPPGGMPFDEYLKSRFGDPAKLQPGLDELVAVGRNEGIDFRFDLISQIPNSLNAHRLINLAGLQGADAHELAEQIFAGFFGRGLDIADPDVLAELGRAVGLARSEVLRGLEDDRLKSLVLSQEAQVRQSGVVSVPDFLVNKRLFVMGAQLAENLVTVFDRAMFGEDSEIPVSATVH